MISLFFQSFTMSSDLNWNPQISIKSTYQADRLIKLMEITIKGIQNKPVEYPQLVLPDWSQPSGLSGSGSETPDDDDDKDDDDDDDDDGNNVGVSGFASGQTLVSASGEVNRPDKSDDGGTTATTSDNTPTLSFRPVTDVSQATSQVQTLPATTPSKSAITTDQQTSQKSTEISTTSSTSSSTSSSQLITKTTVNNQQLIQETTTTSSAVTIQYNSISTMTLICSLAYTLIHYWL